MTKWMLKQTSSDVAMLAHQTGLDPVLVRLLAVRGYKDKTAIAAYLHPEKGKLSDPLCFMDMDKAIARVRTALLKQEKMVVFGDYDADGIMSTVVLLRTFSRLGYEIPYYIPRREGEGYGLNNEAIDLLAEQGTNLIVACDNGVSAFDQIDHAKELGIDVVVIDHHAITSDANGRQVLPNACAVVDAKRLDCPYPFKSYCAAAVCYRFSEALCGCMGVNWASLKRELLPFVTIATICDIVDLVSENRILVKFGLPAIRTSANLGLSALLHEVHIDSEITVYHIGFILGPCINAAGRMGNAELAVNLFLTENASEAKQYAQQLIALNVERRKMTEDASEIVFAQIEEKELYKDKIIVVHSPEISESIAGIVAGRVKEKYYHPSIILGGKNELLHGSGRSIDGYNIFDGLSQIRQFFPSFGGHTLAAGMTIYASDVEEMRKTINENCTLQTEDFQQVFRIDCAFPIGKVDTYLAKSLSLLEPCGKGNERPLFADRNLTLQKVTHLGKTGQTLRWQVLSANGIYREAIDFHNCGLLKKYVTQVHGSEQWNELIEGNALPEKLDIIYTISYETYLGRERARIEIVSFRPSLMKT